MLFIWFLSWHYIGRLWKLFIQWKIFGKQLILSFHFIQFFPLIKKNEFKENLIYEIWQQCHSREPAICLLAVDVCKHVRVPIQQQ